MPLPKQPGFYWAKWTNVEGWTPQAAELTWEVVSVFENSCDKRSEDFLRVMVTGVEQTQAIQDFQWGIGPLTQPNKSVR